MITEVLHISSGMNEVGGGTAHLGRVLGRAMRRFCARRGLRLTGFHLPAPDGGVALDGYHSFGGSKSKLAAALLGRLAVTPGRKAIFADHLGPARTLGLLPRRMLPRYTVQLHGIEIWRELSWDRRRTLANASFLVANSQYTANHLLDYFPAQLDIRVVLLGIEQARLVGRSHTRTLDAVGEGYVLIVGRAARHERYKGHDELLEAWPELLRRLPGARLVVAGSGSDLPRLRAKATELGLGEAVHFTGQVDPATLTELYRRAAVFAMPSLLEGFGLVFVEAMAAGKPCIACAGTAPAEIILDGETGLLVSASHTLVDALAALLGDPERARAMGAAGRRRYEAEFTAEAYERRLEPVLEALVDG